MDDPLFVRGFERVGDLLRNRQCLVDREPCLPCRSAGGAKEGALRPMPFDSLGQILALDEFHHERRDAPTFFEPVDGGDIGMVQRGKRLRFTLEAREPLGVVRERLRQDLDCDVAIELGITRPIDFAHASAADQLDQLEDAEAGTGGKGQRVA